jgi:hypothetical protein
MVTLRLPSYHPNLNLTGLIGARVKEWITSKNTTFNQTAVIFRNWSSKVGKCLLLKMQQISIYEQKARQDTNERTMTAHEGEGSSNARINDK